MIVIDRSDFNNRPYRIDNQAESRDLDDWIAERERELLIQLLGYELFAEFEEGIGSSAPSEFFTNLKNGATYTYGGGTYRYNGLVDVLRPAIYSMWLDQQTYKFTSVGYVENTPSTSSTRIDNEPFRVQAWNDYVRKVGSDEYSCKYNRMGTLLGFLYANTEEFDDSQWINSRYLPTYQNRYSL